MRFIDLHIIVSFFYIELYSEILISQSVSMSFPHVCVSVIHGIEITLHSFYDVIILSGFYYNQSKWQFRWTNYDQMNRLPKLEFTHYMHVKQGTFKYNLFYMVQQWCVWWLAWSQLCSCIGDDKFCITCLNPPSYQFST